MVASVRHSKTESIGNDQVPMRQTGSVKRSWRGVEIANIAMPVEISMGHLWDIMSGFYMRLLPH